jgi:hypothetical protein
LPTICQLFDWPDSTTLRAFHCLMFGIKKLRPVDTPSFGAKGLFGSI